MVGSMKGAAAIVQAARLMRRPECPMGQVVRDEMATFEGEHACELNVRLACSFVFLLLLCLGGECACSAVLTCAGVHCHVYLRLRVGEEAHLHVAERWPKPQGYSTPACK